METEVSATRLPGGEFVTTRLKCVLAHAEQSASI